MRTNTASTSALDACNVKVCALIIWKIFGVQEIVSESAKSVALSPQELLQRAAAALARKRKLMPDGKTSLVKKHWFNKKKLKLYLPNKCIGSLQ